MAIALDSSVAWKVAGVDGDGSSDTVTSSSFDAPAGSYIVVAASSYTATSLSLSDSTSGALTWTTATSRTDGGTVRVKCFAAPCYTARTGLTATLTANGTYKFHALAVYVFTGVSGIANTGMSGTTTTSIPSLPGSGATTAANSAVFLTARDTAFGGAPTSSNGSGVLSEPTWSSISTYRVIATAGDPLAVFVAPGSGSPSWYWGAFELVAGTLVDPGAVVRKGWGVVK